MRVGKWFLMCRNNSHLVAAEPARMTKHMVRILKFFLVALALSGIVFQIRTASAQSSALASTPSPSPTTKATVTLKPTQTPTATDEADEGTPVIAAGVEAENEVDSTAEPSATEDSADDSGDSSPLSTVTPTTVPTLSLTATLNTPLTATLTAPANSAPLEGTILANRSTVVARFFLEGQTSQLSAGRSQGITLPRTTSVLSLFNCAGDLTDDTAGCFWDPYLIQQNGFYEIYDSATAGTPAKLMLREAGTPPTGQVWIQNRTGQSESVVFKEDVYQIEPSAVQEFPVSVGVPAILYVRSCLTIDNQSACEWAPKSLDAGVYYAMVEVDTPGSQSGSTRSTIDLRPVVGESGESEDAATAEVAAVAPSFVCSVVVPALNVRSGPGLQYDIIGKVRTTDGSAVLVNVTGRSTDSEWLTVDPSIADNGWINNSSSFITCSGDVMSLPVIDTPATPTPLPEVVEQPPVTDTTGNVPEAVATSEPSTPGQTTPDQTVPGQSAPDQSAEPIADSSTITPTSTAPTVPAGQSLLIVNNGFAHDIRFTLDQMYRVQEGPSEFDLAPGASISIVVFPGQVPFTASSPWSGLSGNASVMLDHDQSKTLWLRFELQPGGGWDFHFD